MGDIVPFRKPTPAKPAGKPASKKQSKTLCRSGFHKWVVANDQPFNVIKGRLVTVYRCERCGAIKNELR